MFSDNILKNKGLNPTTPFVTAFDLLARHILPRKPHIFIACMPKSGSTFLANSLAEHASLKRVRLVPTYGAREQELCELRLSRYNQHTYISQHHTRNSEWIQILIERYNLTPVVLVRNLFDTVISLRDHLREEFAEKKPHFISITENHLARPDHELEDIIVSLLMPWYLHFYNSWKQCPQALFIRYEDMIADPVNTIRSVLDHAKIKTSDEAITHALASAKTKQNRFNKGVVGRGQKLRPETKQKLLDLIHLYPEYHDDAFFRDMLKNTQLTA